MYCFFIILAPWQYVCRETVLYKQSRVRGYARSPAFFTMLQHHAFLHGICFYFRRCLKNSMLFPNPGFDLSQAVIAADTSLYGAILHIYQCWNAHNLKHASQLRLFINVDFHDFRMFRLLADLFDDRLQHLTGTAPVCIEINEDRLPANKNFGDFITFLKYTARPTASVLG